jgi:hypothetical protein
MTTGVQPQRGICTEELSNKERSSSLVDLANLFEDFELRIRKSMLAGKYPPHGN